MIRQLYDISCIAASSMRSMCSSSTRQPERSWSTEYTARLARRLLSASLTQSDDWLRQRMELLVVPAPVLSKVRFEKKQLAGVPVLRCFPKISTNGESEKAAGRIVYIHGGGYVVGSSKSYRNTLASLAHASNAEVVALDYRLAPENPYPAALEDCRAVLLAMLDEAAKRPLFMAGDSAGAALCLATLQGAEPSARDAVSGCVLISPWVAPGDVSLLVPDQEADDIVSAEVLGRWAKSASARDTAQALSGLFDFRQHRFEHLPPIYVQSGGTEIMAPQIAALVEKLRDHGAKVEHRVYPGQFHVFQTLAPLVREAEVAIHDIAAWIKLAVNSAGEGQDIAKGAGG